MKKWIVSVTETLCRTFEVEAKDSQEAEEKVREAYAYETIILDANDFVDKEIKCESEQDGTCSFDEKL